MTAEAEHEWVYVLLRFDAEAFDPDDPTLSVRAVEVLPTLEHALAERTRLESSRNPLVRYFVTASPWYSDRP